MPSYLPLDDDNNVQIDLTLHGGCMCSVECFLVRYMLYLRASVNTLLYYAGRV